MHIQTTMLALALLTSAAVAQEHSGHEIAASTVDLPPICLANATAAMAPAPSHVMGGSAAHQELMAGMDKMNADMMAGGTAADIDVAFVCSMIPHHRGAIDMARAELAHGDDPWSRQLAEAIIVAQEREITEMLAWLDRQ
jgi:uncharacterized protein (DUF305 family)